MGSEHRLGGAPGYLDFEVEVGVGTGREYPVDVRSPGGGGAGDDALPLR